MGMEETGFATVPNVFKPEEITGLLFAIESVSEETVTAGRGGVRNLLDRAPAVRELAKSAIVRGLVEPVLGKHAFAARGTPAASSASHRRVIHLDFACCGLPGGLTWFMKEFNQR